MAKDNLMRCVFDNDVDELNVNEIFNVPTHVDSVAEFIKALPTADGVQLNAWITYQMLWNFFGSNFYLVAKKKLKYVCDECGDVLSKPEEDCGSCKIGSWSASKL